jgi:hypothetical protein
MVNYDILSKREELEDDGAQEQEVNEGPVMAVSTTAGGEEWKSHQMKNAQGAGVMYVSLPP